MLGHEQGKVFNFFLVSYHSNRCPFHLPAFTTPSPFNSGYTKSRGARQTLEGEPVVSTFAGIRLWPPATQTKKKQPSFQLPREVRASSGS